MRKFFLFLLVLVAQASFAQTASTITLSLDKTAVVAGDSAIGTVTISSPAPVGGAQVTLSSVLPSVVSVPLSVTIPEGETTGTFAVTTGNVDFTVNVSIIAVYQGVGTAKNLIVNPAQVIDTVTIARAEYDAKKRKLSVDATSSNTVAILSVYDAASGKLIGTLSRNKKTGVYSGQFSVSANPGAISVVSSKGGSAKATVG